MTIMMMKMIWSSGEMYVEFSFWQTWLNVEYFWSGLLFGIVWIKNGRIGIEKWIFIVIIFLKTKQ